jgi:Ca2+-binding EF-hand superfamily protein
LIVPEWDVNIDGRIDIKDVAQVSKVFGVNHPSPRYNSDFDFNSDSRIGIKDIAIVAKNFGESY